MKRSYRPNTNGLFIVGKGTPPATENRAEKYLPLVGEISQGSQVSGDNAFFAAFLAHLQAIKDFGQMRGVRPDEFEAFDRARIGKAVEVETLGQTPEATSPDTVWQLFSNTGIHIPDCDYRPATPGPRLLKNTAKP